MLRRATWVWIRWKIVRKFVRGILVFLVSRTAARRLTPLFAAVVLHLHVSVVCSAENSSTLLYAEVDVCYHLCTASIAKTVAHLDIYTSL